MKFTVSTISKKIAAIALALILSASYGAQITYASEPDSYDGAPVVLGTVETDAVFYVINRDQVQYKLNSDPQFYVDLGYGTILKEEAYTEEYDAIAAIIGKTPENIENAELAVNEEIVWYRTLFSGDLWRVYGMRVETETTQILEPKEEAVEIDAIFYVINRDKVQHKLNPDPQYYVSLGYGTILKEEAYLENYGAIAAMIGKMPANIKNAGLAANEEIVWYRTMFSGNRWRVYGVRMEMKPAQIEEQSAQVVEQKEEAAEIDAIFYVINRDKVQHKLNPDPQYYVSLGYGTVLKEQAYLEDYDAIAAMIGKMPANIANAGLAANEEIVWYRTMFSGNRWRVYGIRVETEAVESKDRVVETDAIFYVINQNKVQHMLNPDPQYYVSLGYGTILKEEAYLEDYDAIAAMIGKMPANIGNAGLAANEEIVWYRTMFSGNRWRVYGMRAISDASALRPAPAPVPEQAETAELNLEEMLYAMITNGDGEAHDVKALGMTYAQIDAVLNELINGKARIAYNCYYNLILRTTVENKIVTSIRFDGVDSGFPDRYKNTLASINRVLRGIDNNMSDFEKALYVHEYIVKNTTYKNSGNFVFTASGPLGLGYGVCRGYGQAMVLILKELGIESQYVSAPSINHGWLMICLDGEWYHIDPTWDDTRSPIAGQVGHEHFIRNDSEFRNASSNKHTGWDENSYITVPTSTSTRYSQWFGHSVVGEMHYYNGEWYYNWKGDIVKSDIEGNNRQILVSGEGKTLLITDFTDTEFEYAVR